MLVETDNMSFNINDYKRNEETKTDLNRVNPHLLMKAVNREINMSKEFRNISKVGFMLHNGGLEFKKISEDEYEYRTTLKDFHMNAAGVTHGGYIMSVLDSGMGTAAHQVIDGVAVTITLDIKFISGSKPGEEIIGYAKVKRKTRSLIFMQGELKSNGKTLATSEGIWKIL